MFLQPYIIIIVLLVTMILFIWGYWRYDIVALLALAISVALGAVPLHEVYSGLGNPAVITVACVMVISHAISRSGILDHLINKLNRFTKYQILHVGILSGFTAVMSAFMNNIGALALMMPIAIKTAIENKRSPSFILMPLAMASALGGLITVIGTPPNLLISTYRQEIVGQPFNMFDFTPVGIFVAIAGVLFITLIGWRFIPQRKAPKQPEDIFDVEDYITEVKIPSESPVIGTTVQEFEKMINGDFMLLGLIRNKKKMLVLRPDRILEENDILIIEASTDDLKEIVSVGKFELVGDKKISAEELKASDINIIETVVPQGCRLEGRSSQQIRLRSRFRINLLAISRQGKPFRSRLNHVNFQAGDVMLLQGSEESLNDAISQFGLLPLVARNVNLRRNMDGILALLIFGAAILLSAFQLLPVQVSFGGAILAMVLFKVIPIRLLYDGIEWPVIILLAAMIPIGNALQSTGGTGLITHYIISMSNHYNPILVLVLVFIITMTLSDFMNNAATTIIMAPIAISIAQALKVNVDPFLMAVAISASCSFLTPVGHQNNTLVMGPGGYKFFDYIRLGLPLEILVLTISIPLILWIWPLT